MPLVNVRDKRELASDHVMKRRGVLGLMASAFAGSLVSARALGAQTGKRLPRPIRRLGRHRLARRRKALTCSTGTGESGRLPFFSRLGLHSDWWEQQMPI